MIMHYLQWNRRSLEIKGGAIWGCLPWQELHPPDPLTYIALTPLLYASKNGDSWWKDEEIMAKCREGS